MAISVVVSTEFDELIQQLGDSIEQKHRRESSSLIERWKQSTTIVVPDLETGHALKMALANRSGVVTNLDMITLEKFLRESIQEACGDDVQLLGKETLKTLLVDEFRDFEALPAACRDYLETAGTGGARAEATSRYQLARTLANVFEEYIYSRREMLADWVDNPDKPRDGVEAWQAKLWRKVVERADGSEPTYKPLPVAFDHCRDDLVEMFESNDVTPLRLFGFAGVGRTFLDILESFGADIDVEFYFRSPADELGEVESLHRGLNLWGDVGRETRQQLAELDGADVQTLASEQPEADTVLRRIQRAVANRSGDHHGDQDPDESLRIVDAPGVRREVEIAANDIWRRVLNADGDSLEDSLKFSDVAVVVPRSEASSYAAHIEAVFQSFEGLPYTFNGLEVGTGSPVLDAIDLLLDLPLSECRRSDLLPLLVHPNFGARPRDTAPEDWIEWTDRLNVFYGADQNQQRRRGSYLDGDFFNWNQGMRRLALGAMLDVQDPTEAEPLRIDGSDYLPEPTSLGALGSVSTLHATVGSLLEDARWMTGDDVESPPKKTLAEWGEIMAAMVEHYLDAATTDDAQVEREYKLLVMAREILEDIGDGPQIAPVSYETARLYADDRLDKLRFETGASLLNGVVVSTPDRLRGIPFEHIYLLGAGEGVFPSRDPESELDIRLRDGHERTGDMWPSKRDKYSFLQLVHSANESMTVSWVGRDPTTGEDLPPSSLLRDLASISPVAAGEDETKLDALCVEHRLHRYDTAFYEFPEFHTDKPNRSNDGDDGGDIALNHRRNLHPEAFQEARMVQLRDAGVTTPKPRAGDDTQRPEGRSLWTGRAFVELQKKLDDSNNPSSLRMLRPPQTHRVDDEPNRTLSISLSKLRKFLKTPLQTSAKVRSRIYGDEEDLVTNDRESFEFGNINRAAIFKEAFARRVCRGFEDDPDTLLEDASKEALQQLIHQIAHDKFRPDDLPRQLFSEAAVTQLGESLANALYNYFTWGMEKYSIDTTETPTQYVWGQTRGYKLFDCIAQHRELPAVELEDIEVGDETFDVEITGESLLLFPEQAAMVRPVRSEVTLAKHSPECLVNFVMLMATDNDWRTAVEHSESPPRAFLPAGKTDWGSRTKFSSRRVDFATPVSKKEAHDKLREWVEELLSDPALLPADLAADDWEDEPLTRDSAWRETMNKADGKWSTLQTKYGPVRRFLDYPPPDDPKEILERRFEYHGSLPAFANTEREE